jgi:hypothetical protein
VKKTYTVDEIINGDSSSDEENENYNNNHFPWLKAGYTNKYDDLEYDAYKYNQDTSKYIYPKSTVTDSKVYLSDKQDIKIKYFHR